MNTPDLIQLTVFDMYMNADSFYSRNIEDKVKMPLLISPSSIASVEPIDPEYGKNSRVTMKEMRGEHAISYEVVETVSAIKALVEDANLSDSAKSLRALESMKKQPVAG